MKTPMELLMGLQMGAQIHKGPCFNLQCGNFGYFAVGFGSFDETPLYHRLQGRWLDWDSATELREAKPVTYSWAVQEPGLKNSWRTGALIALSRPSNQTFIKSSIEKTREKHL